MDVVHVYLWASVVRSIAVIIVNLFLLVLLGVQWRRSPQKKHLVITLFSVVGCLMYGISYQFVWHAMRSELVPSMFSASVCKSAALVQVFGLLQMSSGNTILAIERYLVVVRQRSMSMGAVVAMVVFAAAVQTVHAMVSAYVGIIKFWEKSGLCELVIGWKPEARSILVNSVYALALLMQVANFLSFYYVRKQIARLYADPSETSKSTTVGVAVPSSPRDARPTSSMVRVRCVHACGVSECLASPF